MSPLSYLLKLALVIGLFWLALRWLERSSLYFPDKKLIANPAQVGLPYEEVRLQAADGVSIHGWFIPAANTAPAVLLLHGNAGNMSHRLDKAKRLLAAGAQVMLLDYRGYGLSGGRPSEKGIYRDAEAAYRWLTQEKGIAPERVVLYGESLGGAPAIETALRRTVGGMILESPFTSTVDMAAIVFPWLPARWIVRDRYDNAAKISRLRVPLLVLHSPQDDIVPFAMGFALFEAAGEPKRLVELTGDHNEGYIDSGETYIQAVRLFLTTLKPGVSRR